MEAQIQVVNERLKAANVPYKVRLNGRYLVLRGMLPCKPGKGIGRKQQDISMAIPATAAGLRQAERLCHRLSDEVVEGKFLWSSWQNPRRERPEQPPELTRDLVERFKTTHLKSGRCKESTWIYTWGETLGQLPQDVTLKEEAILSLLVSKQPDSRIRQLTAKRLGKLVQRHN